MDPDCCTSLTFSADTDFGYMDLLGSYLMSWNGEDGRAVYVDGDSQYGLMYLLWNDQEEVREEGKNPANE